MNALAYAVNLASAAGERHVGLTCLLAGVIRAAGEREKAELAGAGVDVEALWDTLSVRFGAEPDVLMTRLASQAPSRDLPLETLLFGFTPALSDATRFVPYRGCFDRAVMELLDLENAREPSRIVRFPDLTNKLFRVPGPARVQFAIEDLEQIQPNLPENIESRLGAALGRATVIVVSPNGRRRRLGAAVYYVLWRSVAIATQTASHSIGIDLVEFSAIEMIRDASSQLLPLVEAMLQSTWNLLAPNARRKLRAPNEWRFIRSVYSDLSAGRPEFFLTNEQNLGALLYGGSYGAARANL